MAETLPNSFDDAETDPDKKKGRKRKSSENRIAVPLPVERDTSKSAETKSAKETAKETPKVLLEKLIGKAEPAAESRAETPQEPERMKDDTEAPVAAAETAEHTATNETVTEEAEHNVAEDLYNGAEISLHEVAQVPPDRDKRIVEEALDMAARAEQDELAAPEEAESEDFMDVDMPPIAEQSREAEPVETGEGEDAAATTDQEPDVPAAYMQTPRTTLNPFRSRPYVGRNRPAPVPSPSPESTGADALYGVSSGAAVPPNPNAFSAASNRNTAPATLQNPEVQQALDDVEWQSRQRGRREGVLTGLLVGGGIEHFRHRRREKKLAKQHQKEVQTQQKRVERLESDYAVAREEQRVERTKTESTITNLQRSQETERKEHEKQAAVAREQAKQRAQEQAQIEEGLAIPKDHHVERSAWHNIEVDKSGRAVQESAFEYGHEYYKERAHEMSPAQQQQIDSAAGEVALVAAALNDTPGSAPQAQGQDQSQTASQPRAAAQEQTAATAYDDSTSRKIVKTITTPPTTPTATLAWLGVLIIIVLLILALAT